MRRVITGVEKQTVLVQSLDESHIIGVEFVSGLRAILKKTNTGDYGSFSLDDNYGKPLAASTIEAYIELLNLEAFVFETEKEIGEWLIEQL